MKALSHRRALLAGALSLACTTASAGSYTYTSIIVPGAKQTSATAINGAGTVVGYWSDQNYNRHGFIFVNGTVTSFDVAKSVSTYAAGISDKGEIVGSFQDSDYNTHGFVRSASGKTTIVDLPGSGATSLNAVSPSGAIVGEGTDSGGNLETFTYKKGVFTVAIAGGDSPIAAAINDQGSIAGTYEAPNTHETAFLYADGAVMTIPIDNVYFAQSYAINSHNSVVGQTASQTAQLGFLYRRGKVKIFGPRNGGPSYFTGINDHDTIIGATNSNGFVFDHGTYTTLAIPGASSVVGAAINNAGQIAGSYEDANNVLDGFIAVP